MKLFIPLSISLFALSTLALANHTPMQSDAVMASGKLYVGVLGGGGSSNHFKASQFGTAFFREAIGGPLSVNAFGRLKHKNGAFYGAQLGYQAQEISLCSSSQWTLGPAVELEGFFMKKRSFTGTLFNNTSRLPEHDFIVSYPMKRTVYLANAVVSIDNPCLMVHPYIGFGIGSALIKITDADSKQVRPFEVGVNHFNSNPRDSNSTFAGQIKVGLSYDICDCVSLLAEYRWLYVANTLFVFGSTVYPTHAETSSWQVKLKNQKYNLVNLGIRYTW